MNNDEIEAVVLALIQHGRESVNPSAEQLRDLLGANPAGPFHFLNLLSFKETAEYPAGHELADQRISGADAYDKYGAVALEHVIKRGGRLVTLNSVERQLAGRSTEWHRIATMEYNNVGAFIDMLMDPQYQEALVHRDAGLEATEIYVSRPLIAEPIG